MVIRLVAVDRHTLARLGLAYAIAGADDIELVGEAGDAAQARRLVAELTPTVVTVDAELSDCGGIEFGQELIRTYPGMGVVLLAAADNGLLLRALPGTTVSRAIVRSVSVSSRVRQCGGSAVSASQCDHAAAAASRRAVSTYGPRTVVAEAQSSTAVSPSLLVVGTAEPGDPVPASALLRPRRPSVSGDAAQAKALLVEHCAACHLVPGHRRPHGVAEVGAPPFAVIARAKRTYPEARLRTFLRRPHWPMTRFILSGRDIDNIMAYLRELGGAAEE